MLTTAATPATDTARAESAVMPVQPRARGRVEVEVKRRDQRTVLRRLSQSGSLKLLFPRSTGPACQAVLVNTAGGITGGDRFSVKAVTAPGTNLTLTTQAAERAYRAQPGETGSVQSHLSVTTEARLNWLPQETILFQGSALERRLTVDLSEGASLLLCEPLVFGRAAMGEHLARVTLSDRIEVFHDGRPLFLDALQFSGNLSEHLAKSHTAAGAGAMASLLLVAPDAERHLEPIRATLPERAGASLLRPGVLFTRVLAGDSFELRQTLMPVLTRLSHAPLPRPWMI